jgi:hypothetical protein
MVSGSRGIARRRRAAGEFGGRLRLGGRGAKGGDFALERGDLGAEHVQRCVHLIAADEVELGG